MGLLSACQPTPSRTYTSTLRAPAYPLVTIDPYTSAWSTTDNLFDSPVRHWTGKSHPLVGAIRVDNQVYRFLGKEEYEFKSIIPSADYSNWHGRYSLAKPATGWETLGFADHGWQQGKGAFGTPGMPSVGTLWNSGEIWVRREFVLPDTLDGHNLYLLLGFDDDIEVYLNGQKIADAKCCATSKLVPIDPSMLNVGGKNMLAAHCVNTGGEAFIDLGVFLNESIADCFGQPAIQTKVEYSATQTFYRFACGPVDLDLSFVSPLVLTDLDLLSRPVNYINYSVKSRDTQPHDVQIYFEATPQWAVNHIAQEVEVVSGETDRVRYFKAGTTSQPILEKKGDDLRIDWGYFYLGAPKSKTVQTAIGMYADSKKSFAQNGALVSASSSFRGSMLNGMPVMACVDALGQVGDKPKSGYVMVGYDDLESIQYFGNNLKALWKKDGKVTMARVLDEATVSHGRVLETCNEFDRRVFDDANAAGGPKYADLCLLAYRQAVAAHKLVRDTVGDLLFMSKENFSNGSIATVDVTYPSAPLFLKYNPELLKGMMNPIFYYSESRQWTKPFAAHDVGTYPLANGQTYGGDMPVEECGNMLILSAAIAQVEGNAEYARKHWDVLTVWADYLLRNGLDPENQLCTDDFAGHFAHNVNLSAKAVTAIACYGRLARLLGKQSVADFYEGQARHMAKEWEAMAFDGDHYRLTFDQPGTWSQKYNLVWDKLLGLNLFSPKVVDTETAYYLTKQNTYGLPLDSRRTYTKSDWVVWTATMANDPSQFDQLITPLHRFVSSTPDRVPMTDWYETTDAQKVGFQARSVVGGYFIKMLDPNLNNKPN